jgi:hypothetical protein
MLIPPRFHCRMTVVGRLKLYDYLTFGAVVCHFLGHPLMLHCHLWYCRLSSSFSYVRGHCVPAITISSNSEQGHLEGQPTHHTSVLARNVLAQVT